MSEQTEYIKYRDLGCKMVQEFANPKKASNIGTAMMRLTELTGKSRQAILHSVGKIFAMIAESDRKILGAHD